MITDEQREQFIAEAQHLAAMIDSPGWKIFEADVHERLNGDGKLRPGLINMLIDCNEPERIRDLQANIRSLKLLLAFPRQMVEAAQKATDEASAAKSTDAPA